MKRGKLWLKRLAIVFVATLVSCLIAEVAVVLILGEQVKFPRHVVGAPFGIRINEPNSRYRHTSPDVDIEFRINSKGFRSDREYTREKSPGKLRILSLGDSFTAGYEVEVEECFSSILERELTARGYDVEVINAGVSGFSNAEEFLYLARELINYEPDLVLVSFYTNDLADNTRTGLFRLDRDTGELKQVKDSYVPMGKLANFLNTNWLFSWLSENSNAFALLKDQSTLLIKQRMSKERLESIKTKATEPSEEVETREAPEEGWIPAQSRLACAIFDRMYAALQKRGIPLVIQSIPHMAYDEEGWPHLVDEFPAVCFDFERDGVSLVTVGEALVPYVAKEQLYYKRSNKHWTPLAHDLSGKMLADHIDSAGLLAK